MDNNTNVDVIQILINMINDEINCLESKKDKVDDCYKNGFNMRIAEANLILDFAKTLVDK